MCALDARQKEAAAQLGRGVPIGQVAEAAGVSIKTIHDWRYSHSKCGEFQAAIAAAANEWTRELLGEALGSMRQVVGDGANLEKVQAARVISDRVAAVERHSETVDKNKIAREALALEREKEAAKRDALAKLNEAAPNGVVVLNAEGMGWPVQVNKPPADPA